MTFQSYHTKAPFSIINLQKINGKCLFNVRIKEALRVQPLVKCMMPCTKDANYYVKIVVISGAKDLPQRRCNDPSFSTTFHS